MKKLIIIVAIAVTATALSACATSSPPSQAPTSTPAPATQTGPTDEQRAQAVLDRLNHRNSQIHDESVKGSLQADEYDIAGLCATTRKLDRMWARQQDDFASLQILDPDTASQLEDAYHGVERSIEGTDRAAADIC